MADRVPGVSGNPIVNAWADKDGFHYGSGAEEVIVPFAKFPEPLSCPEWEDPSCIDPWGTPYNKTATTPPANPRLKLDAPSAIAGCGPRGC